MYQVIYGWKKINIVITVIKAWKLTCQRLQTGI